MIRVFGTLLSSIIDSTKFSMLFIMLFSVFGGLRVTIFLNLK